ncbi:hypothetical protein BDD43_3516 [Mucilaginibacter gracilis]|uniref:Uncharacterized protein n=1 Tax=Mucilaginibacter gracilis TaxID=423350 RepID=A0A495J3Q9_9SPHI|nr:hypothetical protein [Mucilaginibacter gracilis]RKR83311.1 hypothetical protein BDD43_3516 [Mucilaginibacter gracilis]
MKINYTDFNKFLKTGYDILKLKGLEEIDHYIEARIAGDKSFNKQIASGLKDHMIYYHGLVLTLELPTENEIKLNIAAVDDGRALRYLNLIYEKIEPITEQMGMVLCMYSLSEKSLTMELFNEKKADDFGTCATILYFILDVYVNMSVLIENLAARSNFKLVSDRSVYFDRKEFLKIRGVDFNLEGLCKKYNVIDKVDNDEAIGTTPDDIGKAKALPSGFEVYLNDTSIINKLKTEYSSKNGSNSFALMVVALYNLKKLNINAFEIDQTKLANALKLTFGFNQTPQGIGAAMRKYKNDTKKHFNTEVKSIEKSITNLITTTD